MKRKNSADTGARDEQFEVIRKNRCCGRPFSRDKFHRALRIAGETSACKKHAKARDAFRAQVLQKKSGEKRTSAGIFALIYRAKTQSCSKVRKEKISCLLCAPFLCAVA